MVMMMQARALQPVAAVQSSHRRLTLMPVLHAIQSSQKADAHACAACQAIGYGDEVFIMGGHNSNDESVVDTNLLYDPILQTYTPMAALPEPRAQAMAALLNGSIYIVGGLTSGDPDGKA